VPIWIGTSVDLPAEWVPIWVGIRTYNFKGEASDEIVNAAIRRSQQDAKIGQSAFAPKDFVDWNPIRAVQQELKR